MHKNLQTPWSWLEFCYLVSLDVLKMILLFSVKTDMLVKHAELTDIKLGKEFVNVLCNGKHLKYLQ